MTLGERRKRLGYSQEALAADLDVDRRTVGRWECGKALPQPCQRPRLAKLLQVELHELDVLIAETRTGAAQEPVTVTQGSVFSAGVSDDMIRREFLRLVAVTSALSATSDDATADGSETTDAHAGTFAAMNNHLWQVFQMARTKAAVHPLVHGQTAALADCLADGNTRQHHTLVAAAADLFQLAGELAFDQNRYTDAAVAYSLATSAAKDSKAYDLWACGLTRLAYVDLYENRYTQAASTLSAAERIARRGDPQLSTRHWIASVQAEAHAGLGDLASCERALDVAQEVTAGTVSGNGGWLRFDGSRLAEERGARYVRLERLDLAERALQDALRLDGLAPGLSLRRRAAVLTDLAAIGAKRRDVEQLTSYADQAIKICHKSSSGYVARRLGDLRTACTALSGDRRVAELNARIRALTV